MSALTDRELLELAAKAAGLGEVWYLEGSNTPYVGPRYEPGKPIRYSIWSPLTNDGDALRLAVKLGIEPHKPSRSRSVGRVVQAWFPPSGNPDRAATAHVSVLVDGDAYAATRRAIVCAAAALAKFTQEKANG